jgi:hypothetical protein
VLGRAAYNRCRLMDCFMGILMYDYLWQQLAPARCCTSVPEALSFAGVRWSTAPSRRQLKQSSSSEQVAKRQPSPTAPRMVTAAGCCLPCRF